MSLTSGIHHVAITTHDFDRLAGFYADVFDADHIDLGTMPHPPYARHGVIRVGERAVLHAFELTDRDLDCGLPNRIGERGRIDHYAICVEDESALRAIAVRLVEAGASDGVVSEFGPSRSVYFEDPDGAQLEVATIADGVDMDALFAA